METKLQPISGKLLRAIQGEKKDTPVGYLVDKGAYLWGVEDKEKGKGILNHVLLVSRVADCLAQQLQKSKISGYETLNRQHVVEAAILHDIAKLYGEDREKLSLDEKNKLGLQENFKEISVEVEEKAIEWLKELGFSDEVQNAIVGHDFPEKIINDPYWKITLVADYMVGQRVMNVHERLSDIKNRWIESPKKEGKQPRITPERFKLAEKIITKVADDLFRSLGTTDQEFIEHNKLNALESMTRWEEFIMKTMTSGKEAKALKFFESLSNWQEKK